jgi:hypothetical protein
MANAVVDQQIHQVIQAAINNHQQNLTLEDFWCVRQPFYAARHANYFDDVAAQALANVDRAIRQILDTYADVQLPPFGNYLVVFMEGPREFRLAPLD